MRMYDLIQKKRDGGVLSEEEIRWMIQEYVADRIPEYQMAAMLMAIYLKGMNKEETVFMTHAVTHSGDVVDLSPIHGVKVDKHSTGGVGDKTTLVIAPVVAACGVKVAKMSGRGLAHTGGTVDKLESIPGFCTEMDEEKFFKIVNQTGICVIGQSGNLTPADKKLYALRDVTATVDNIPLIAVSIMGKKLAAGNDAIVLDVTTGSGAFMKRTEDAVELALKMTEIGDASGKRTAALITDMDEPLGYHIGNNLEVIEALEVLHGRGPEDLKTVCKALATKMLYISGIGTMEECEAKVKEAIESGRALGKFVEMTKAQGGDAEYVLHPEKFARAPYKKEICSEKSGYLYHMNTESCGVASSLLGAGRLTKESKIDLAAGIVLKKKTGDEVKAGEVLAEFYTSDEALFAAAEKLYLEAMDIRTEKPERRSLILAEVENGKVKYF